LKCTIASHIQREISIKRWRAGPLWECCNSHEMGFTHAPHISFTSMGLPGFGVWSSSSAKFPVSAHSTSVDDVEVVGKFIQSGAVGSPTPRRSLVAILRGSVPAIIVRCGLPVCLAGHVRYARVLSWLVAAASHLFDGHSGAGRFGRTRRTKFQVDF